MRISLPPLAVAQRMEVTVEEGAEKNNGRKHHINGLG